MSLSTAKSTRRLGKIDGKTQNVLAVYKQEMMQDSGNGFVRAMGAEDLQLGPGAKTR